ncbi:unnamed protein product [Protopolystoma xenopodis]|uniref:Lipoprotein n=1 Tax=Protopolystoma xenopodis TaxID=117903 RepID=A0A3S5CGZ5_9PLAT|nr:unnamed protein product [Protopolystoma xenopodis]
MNIIMTTVVLVCLFSGCLFDTDYEDNYAGVWIRHYHDGACEGIAIPLTATDFDIGGSHGFTAHTPSKYCHAFGILG